MDDHLNIDKIEKNSHHDREFRILQMNNTMNNIKSPNPLSMLLRGVLPPYSPPIHVHSRANNMLYTCQECTDKFVIQNSFVNHMDRRSMVILLACPYCRQNIEFYNRCRFLEHFRTLHPEVSLENFNPQFITIQPVPLHWVVKQPTVTSNLKSFSLTSPNLANSTLKQITPSVTIQNISPHNNNINNNSKMLSSKSSTIFSSTSNNKDLQMETNDKDESDNVLPLGNSCNECGEEVNQMKSHYLGSTLPIPFQEELTCKDCSLPLPTKCSYLAHKRLHSMKRPFICPECVIKFSTWNELNKHLKTECFHLDKSIGILCPECNDVFKTMVTYQVHLLTGHVKDVFKCNACPIACFTVEALREHKLKCHNLNSGPINSYQQCKLCPDRLIPKSQTLFHVSAHSKEQKVQIIAYQCSKCKFLTPSKKEFSQHEHSNDDTGGNVETTPSFSSPNANENKQELCKCLGCGKRLLYSVPPPDKQRFIPRCNQCIKETSVVIKKRNGKDILFLKKSSDKSGKLLRLPDQDQEMLTKAFEKTPPEKKMYSCHMCKAQLEMDWKTIQDHFRTEHPENGVMLLTGLNGTQRSANLVSSTPVSNRRTKNDISPDLSITEDDTKQEKDLDTKSKKKPIINRKSNTGSSPPKKRKRNSSDKPSPDEEPFSSGQILKASNPIKITNSNGNSKKKFTCSKCGHSEKDIKSFRLHAINHRDSNSPFPCLECGACFVVKPSFSKHLHVAHRLQDVDAYMKEHGLIESGEEGDPPKLTSVNNRQCRVCREWMPSQDALNVHLRVHGMAFLRIRGARRAPVSRGLTT